MKQFTRLAVSCVLSLVASGAFAQDVTLRLWDGYTQRSDQMDTIIAAFEELHPGVHITRDVMSTADKRPIIQTALNSGTGPDLFTYDTGQGYAGVLADAGLLLPIDDMFDGGSLAHIFPWARQTTTFNGQTIGVGNGIEFLGVYYNKDIFAELGLDVPATYAEFLAACQALKDAGVFPVAFGNSEAYPAFHTFSEYVNAEIPKDEVYAMISGEKSWDDPRVTNAIQKAFVDMMANGYYSPSPNAVNYTDANALFSSGQAGMDITGSWMIPTFSETPFETGVFFLPAEDGGASRPPAGLGGGWFISAKSAHPDEARAFLSFLFAPENAHYWIEDMNEIPTYPVDASGMNVPPMLSFALEALATEDMGYSIDVYVPESFNTEMADGFQAVIAGDRTAAEQATALQASMP